MNSIILLPFGNVMIASFILLIIFLMICLVVEGLRYFVRFSLRLDDEGAPEILKESLPDKWLALMYKVLSVKYSYKVGETGSGMFFIINPMGEYFDESDGQFGSATWATAFHTRASAEQMIKDKLPEGGSRTLLPAFGTVVGVDVMIFLAGHWFLPTVILGGFVGIIFMIRTLAGVVWKHNTRITTLEDKE